MRSLYGALLCLILVTTADIAVVNAATDDVKYMQSMEGFCNDPSLSGQFSAIFDSLRSLIAGDGLMNHRFHRWVRFVPRLNLKMSFHDDVTTSAYSTALEHRRWFRNQHGFLGVVLSWDGVSITGDSAMRHVEPLNDEESAAYHFIDVPVHDDLFETLLSLEARLNALCAEGFSLADEWISANPDSRVLLGMIAFLQREGLVAQALVNR